jgi:pentatricopeptide repeat protein
MEFFMYFTLSNLSSPYHVNNQIAQPKKDEEHQTRKRKISQFSSDKFSSMTQGNASTTNTYYHQKNRYYHKRNRSYHQKNTYSSQRSTYSSQRKKQVLADIRLIHLNQKLKEAFAEGQYPQACIIFKDIINEGLKPDGYTFNILLHYFAQQRNREETLSLWSLMESMEVVPDRCLYNTKLHLFVNLLDKEGALNVLEDMKKANIQSDAYTYCDLLSLYDHLGDELGFTNTWKEMEELNIKPTSVSYNIMIDHYVKQQNWDAARELFVRSMFSYSVDWSDRYGCYQLDCHGLSHGSACMMVDDYLRSQNSQLPLIIVTGVGYHSKQSEFLAMKHQVWTFICKVYPEIHCQETNNLGVIYLH